MNVAGVQIPPSPPKGFPITTLVMGFFFAQNTVLTPKNTPTNSKNHRKTAFAIADKGGCFLSNSDIVEIALHAVGCVLFHLLACMTVNIECKRCCRMP